MNNKCIKSKSVFIKIVCCSLLLAVLSISLMGCNAQDIDDFTFEFDDDHSKYYIRGISKLGQQKEELIIPSTISNAPVVALGSIYAPSYFSSPNLKKIFWAGDQKLNNSRIIDDCPKLETIVFTSAYPSNYSEFFSEQYARVFKHDKKFIRIILLDEVKEWILGHEDLYYVPDYVIDSPSPNVYFYYNFKNAPNSGYSWIDYLEIGAKIKTLPSEPTREGYEFIGWYIDEMCTQKADLKSCVKGDMDLSFYAGWKEK